MAWGRKVHAAKPEDLISGAHVVECENWPCFPLTSKGALWHHHPTYIHALKHLEDEAVTIPQCRGPRVRS